MTKFFVTLSILAIFTTACIAQEVESPVTLYVNGGLAIPTNPQSFSDYWNMGFDVGGGLGYAFTPSVALTASFDYNRFGLNADKFGVSGYGISITGGEASILTFMGNAKLSVPLESSPVTPYMLAGAGVFHLSINDVNVSGYGSSLTMSSDSETDFAVQFGAGIDIQAAEKTSLFLQIGYGLGFTKGDKTGEFPLKAGVAFKM